MQQIGNYTYFEVIEIFGMRNGQIFNIFILIVFQDGDFIEIKEKYLTRKLQKLDKFTKWGILKRILSIEDGIDIYRKLIKEKV